MSDAVVYAQRRAGSEAWRRPAAIGLGVLLLVIAPMVVYPVFLMKLMCFALFASAFNLLLGYVGLLSFGHAAFFGGGAYICAYLMKSAPVTPEVAILAGTGFAALLGLAMGFLAIRRQGIYFSMITLALSQMFFFFCVQAPFTKGEDGLQSVPRGHLFGMISLDDNTNMYWFVAAVFLAGCLLIRQAVYSPFGNILRAIRDNEARATSLGYRVERYKLGAFVLSAAMAGLAGSVKALVFQLASLTDVTWQMSGEPILMTVLGGLGTLLGPIVGAAVEISLEHFLSSSSLPVPVMVGIVFVTCIMLFRRGIVGEILASLSKRKRTA